MTDEKGLRQLLRPFVIGHVRSNLVVGPVDLFLVGFREAFSPLVILVGILAFQKFVPLLVFRVHLGKLTEHGVQIILAFCFQCHAATS